MRAIWIISTLTLREAIRNKILYLLFFFALFLVFSSWVIGQLTIGDQLKIIKDMGISSIHFFGILIAIFIGIGLIFRELEKRTVYLVLSKPLRRYQFLMGKFLGLAVTLLVVLCGLVLMFYLLLLLKSETSPKILLVFYPIYLEWLLVAGIALFFSSFSTPLLSGMLTLGAFICGHLSRSLLLLNSRLHSEISGALLSGIFYLIPDLELFNIRTQVVHGLGVSLPFVAETTLYWIAYESALLLIAIYIFEKKDLV